MINPEQYVKTVGLMSKSFELAVPLSGESSVRLAVRIPDVSRLSPDDADLLALVVAQLTGRLGDFANSLRMKPSADDGALPYEQGGVPVVPADYDG